MIQQYDSCVYIQKNVSQDAKKAHAHSCLLQHFTTAELQK
jgi:hypothetical protein